MLLALAALTPAFVVIGFNDLEIDRSRRAEVYEQARRSAQQAASEVERVLAGVESLLTAVSEVPDIRQLNEEGCAAYLERLRPNIPTVVSFAVVDATGWRRCGSNPSPSPHLNYSDRTYFRAALQASRVVVGEFARGRVSGQLVLPIALAIRDDQQHPVAVVVASLNLMWLGDLLKARGLPPGGSVTVADRRGTVLARQPYPERLVGTQIPDEFMHFVQAKDPGVETVMSRDGTRRVLGYVPASNPDEGLYVSAGLSAEASYEAVMRATRISAILAGIAGAATLAATWWIGSYVFVQPVRHLSGVLIRWRTGDRQARTGLTSERGEIGLVGVQLDRLMDDVVASHEHRQLLTEELAHRVKNTLATVQAIAAATMNKPEPGTALLPDFMQRIAALSRTHDVLTLEQWDAADVREIITGVAAPLVGDVGARFHLDGPDMVLPPKEALAMTMVLHELCTNALKHGALKTAAGQVHVSWSVDEGADGRDLALVWKEEAAEAVVPPSSSHRGFGTRMLARAFGDAGAAVVEFEPTGVRCSVHVRLTGFSA